MREWHSRAGQNWDGLKCHVWSLHSNSGITFPLVSTENHFAYLNHITKWHVLETKTQKNLSSAVKHSWITQGRSYSEESVPFPLFGRASKQPPTLPNIKHFFCNCFSMLFMAGTPQEQGTHFSHHWKSIFKRSPQTGLPRRLHLWTAWTCFLSMKS